MHDMKQISSETVIQWGWRMRHARCLRLIAGKEEMEREKEREKEKPAVSSTYSKWNCDYYNSIKQTNKQQSTIP